ncbi:MAG: glycoside hydrolase family 5 protein [Oscillospiraceae bacterium]
MKKTKFGAILLAAVMALTGCSASDGGSSSSFGRELFGVKPATMIDMTSQQLVDSIRIGWNLGNTLDVCQADRDGDGRINEHVEEGEEVSETLWGNPYATRELFLALADDGVNAVRIPVTWRDHIDDEGNINEAWLNRVQQVVDFAYDSGMYVIINVHHDGGGDPQFGAWICNAAADYDATLARYKTLWTQIAERFKNYSERLIFESMNEVGFDSLPADKAYETLNNLNREFVDLIRNSGGNNPERHLLIAGYWTDIEKTCDSRFVMPNDPAGKSIVSVHYYTPWQFCTTNIQNEWGTPAEEREMERLIGKMKSTFTDNGIPVIIGEYAASGNDKDSVIYFCEKLVKLCSDSGIATFLWDNGGQVDRNTYEWRTPELLEALKRATSGEEYTPVKGAVSGSAA